METVLTEKFNETVSINHRENADITFADHSKGMLVINFENDCVSSKLDIEVQESANVTIFLHNKSHQAFHLDIDVVVKKEANCQMGLLDIENSPLYWKHNVDLCETGAHYQILSGQLCMADMKKICSMEVRHTAPHTSGNIQNFAVLMDRGEYEMVANGNITKGCSGAQSHQATRVLTLGKDHKTKCIPLLLIDENDVKASHALTMGQPDKDQMYYLRSRGLTPKQAIGLLSVGYFLPVISMIKDAEMHSALQQDMESKVGLYGRQ